GDQSQGRCVEPQCADPRDTEKCRSQAHSRHVCHGRYPDRRAAEPDHAAADRDRVQPLRRHRLHRRQQGRRRRRQAAAGGAAKFRHHRLDARRSGRSPQGRQRRRHDRHLGPAQAAQRLDRADRQFGDADGGRGAERAARPVAHDPEKWIPVFGKDHAQTKIGAAMQFTDIFIRRPVLASVVSLLILVLGLRAYAALPILQYPRTQNAVVTVTTIYYGADPEVVAGFITTPLENAIAQANGIDYMNSLSQNSVSTITVTLRLNYEPDKALTEINTKVASVLNQLPPGTQQPTLTVKIGQTIDAMYIGFNSDTLAPNQITDYLSRVVQPKLQAVPGVQTAELLGQKVFALRAWLDPQKLAAFGLTATDVSQALTANDYISGIGNTKGQMVQVNLSASTSLHSAE